MSVGIKEVGAMLRQQQKQNNKNEANDDTKKNSKPANFHKITQKQGAESW